MSTRSGEFVTLRQLREEVGDDAARFFYVMRSNDQHLDFDLELAKSRSNDNPVYYIQYAHARICSVFRQLEEKGLSPGRKAANLACLTEDHEQALMTGLSKFNEALLLAADNRAPQHLVHYLRDLAQEFHTYYNAHQFLVDDVPLRECATHADYRHPTGAHERSAPAWRLVPGEHVNVPRDYKNAKAKSERRRKSRRTTDQRRYAGLGVDARLASCSACAWQASSM